MEAVVTVVVFAILSAYATLELFGLKESADATEDVPKIKVREARFSQEALDTGRAGGRPAIGSAAEFRQKVVAQSAPDNALIPVDWRFET